MKGQKRKEGREESRKNEKEIKEKGWEGNGKWRRNRVSIGKGNKFE